MKEVLRSGDRLLSPEEIEGHDFRVPTIRWNGFEYELYGLGLPYNWEDHMGKIKKLNFNFSGGEFEKETNLACELHRDESTGLIEDFLFGDGVKKQHVFYKKCFPLKDFMRAKILPT